VAELARQLKAPGEDVRVYSAYYAYYADEVYPDILEGIPVRPLFRKNNPVRISGARFLGLPVSSIRLTLKELLSSQKNADLLEDDIDVLNVHEILSDTLRDALGRKGREQAESYRREGSVEAYLKVIAPEMYSA
jgi:hypothetical protein